MRSNAHRARLRKAYTDEFKKVVKELTGPHHYWTVSAAKQIAPGIARTIMQHHLPGISTISQGRRFYPSYTTASQLLGYTSDGDGANGAGLEHMLNPVLGARSGEQATVHGPDSTLETITVKPPHNGRSVTLTIDSNIQSYVQKVLARTVRQYRARAATGIVMDPRTGAVLAMASAPGYNNNGVHDLPTKAFRRVTVNSAVQDAYEPGSVMKVVTFSAALSAHYITPSTQFKNLPNHIRFYDKVITDAEARGPETFTAKQILEKSSNVGTDTIAKMVGPELLQKWIYRYGLGEQTPLHLYGESPGIVRPLKDWSGSSLGTIPIGQGISVTAMQMANIYAAIANGGVMPQTHLIDRVAGNRPVKLHPRRVSARELIVSWSACWPAWSTSRSAPVCWPRSLATPWPARPARLKSPATAATSRANTSRRSSASSLPATPRSRFW